MIKNIGKCILFFLLIETIFLVIGGGYELIITKIFIYKSNPSIIKILGFPIAGLIIFLIIYLVFSGVYNQFRDWTAFNRKNIVKFLVLFIIIGMVFPVMVYLAQINGIIYRKPNVPTFNWNVVLLSPFVIAFLVGITEEFIYRGVLFSYFISNSNVLFSVIFISVIFSLGHVNYSGFLPFLTAFMMSIVSIQLLVLTKSLYASVGMHSSWNFFYSILDQTYDLKLNIIPFWGNLFEIHQMALFFILFLILLAILKKKKISYQNFKSWRTLKETETQMKLAG